MFGREKPAQGGCCGADAPEAPRRVPMVAGNWKMNPPTYSAAVQLAQLVVDRLKNSWEGKVDVVMFPPFTALRGVSNVISFDKSFAQVGAQDCYTAESGAFTGEVSVNMIKDLDCTWCLVGHSERRSVIGEPDALVREKCAALAAKGVSPMLCVGEPEDVYDAGGTVDYVSAQVRAALSDIELAPADLAVAYEPVWAIGSGRVPTPEHVQKVAEAIRKTVEEVRCPVRAASTRILYGGSVKPGNAAQFAALPDVDGVLVGGDSLDADKFFEIVEKVMNA